MFWYFVTASRPRCPSFEKHWTLLFNSVYSSIYTRHLWGSCFICFKSPFPTFSGKELSWQCRRHRSCGFSTSVGKIPWKKKMATPLQHSCLGNPMDRGTWWDRVHGVTRGTTEWLNKFPTFTVYWALIEMCHTHHLVLAWLALDVHCPRNYFQLFGFLQWVYKCFWSQIFCC